MEAQGSTLLMAQYFDRHLLKKREKASACVKTGGRHRVKDFWIARGRRGGTAERW